MSRRRSRSQDSDIDSMLARLIVFVALIYGPGAWIALGRYTWGIPLAITGGVFGLLGVGLFSFTYRDLRNEEHRRKLITTQKAMDLNPTDFEHYVGELFNSRGYNAKVTGRAYDGGVDLRLDNGEAKSIVQCKRYKGNVGVKALREFTAVCTREHVVEGFLVTTSDFTTEAKRWVRSEPITLVNGDMLADWAKDAHFGVYAEPLPRPRFYFTVKQWAVLILLLLGVLVVVTLFLLLIMHK